MESVVYTKTSKIQNCDYRISNLEFHNYPVVFQVEHNENSDEIYCVALYKEVFLMEFETVNIEFKAQVTDDIYNE